MGDIVMKRRVQLIGLFTLFIAITLVLSGCGPTRNLKIRKSAETVEADTRLIFAGY